MASMIIVGSQAAIAAYTTSTDILFWSDPLKGGTFSYYTSITGYASSSDDDGIVIYASGVTSGFWVRQVDGDILPEWFGVLNDGTAITQATLNKWMKACVNFKKAVHFPEGVYCFPIDFQYDFGSFDLTITGIRNKSVITSYDNTAATNFAVPEKIDITKPKPKDGVYQIDITGIPYSSSFPDLINHINSAFSAYSMADIDKYIQISSGVVSTLSLATVKGLGYVTELDTTAGDPGVDGLYVVAKHAFVTASYGGGFAQINLNGIAGFSTSGLDVWFLQGTILKRQAGIWSRYFSGTLSGVNVASGGGFGTQGNFVVQDMIFDNTRFYLFSPFDVVAATISEKTNNLFSISGCTFKNCARVISSMLYGGLSGDKTWFRNVYPTYGNFHFKKLSIIDNDFSYIHECISWAVPPSQSIKIERNNVHDCYTILTTFYLYVQTPSNTSQFWVGKIAQTINDNSFIRIRPQNPAGNSTTTIIRTSGAATVNDNIYIDITQQAIYIAGSNSTFSDNSVLKFIDDGTGYTECPVMLTKLQADQGMVELSGNTIIAPLSSLIMVEGDACFNVVGNTYRGSTKIRDITVLSTEMSQPLIYRILDLATFQTLAGTNADASLNYDPSIIYGNWVYFNKRKSIWVKLLATPPASCVFSKSNSFSSQKQHLTIASNALMECENITSIQSDNDIIFRSVSILNNAFRYVSNLHLGYKVTVEEYIVNGNYFRDGSLVISSPTGPTGLATQVKSLFVENNRISKTLGQTFLFAYQDIVFNNNSYFPDPGLTVAVYANYGITIPIYFEGVILRGTTDSICRIIVANNEFVTIHSRTIALQLEDIYFAEIKNNVFHLPVPANMTNFGYTRTALNIKNSVAVNAIVFTANTILPEVSKTNYLLGFDNVVYAIASLTVNSNKTPQNGASVTNTILGPNKTITVYYKGTNQYNALSDSFVGGGVTTTIVPV